MISGPPKQKIKDTSLEIITGGDLTGSAVSALTCIDPTLSRLIYRLFLHLGTPRNANPIGSVAANELEP